MPLCLKFCILFRLTIINLLCNCCKVTVDMPAPLSLPKITKHIAAILQIYKDMCLSFRFFTAMNQRIFNNRLDGQGGKRAGQINIRHIDFVSQIIMA